MNNRPRVREKERCKLVRKYGYAGYYIKFVLPQKQNAEKEGNVAENDLIRRRDVLKLIEDIKGGRCVMKRKRTERTVNVKAWGRLGAKRVVLYEDRDELRFTDGFHDMRMTQARMEAFAPGGDAVLADVYRRVRGTRNWHPVVKELKKLLDEGGGKAV